MVIKHRIMVGYKIGEIKMEWRKINISDEPLEGEFIIIIRDKKPAIGLYEYNDNYPIRSPFIATTDGRFIEVKNGEYYTYFNFPGEKEVDINEQTNANNF